MFIPGMSNSAGQRCLSPSKYFTNQIFSIPDLETSREETKVRLRWHEHWQTRYSSQETEEEVNIPTRSSREQQVRPQIISLSTNIDRERDENPTIDNFTTTNPPYKIPPPPSH